MTANANARFVALAALDGSLSDTSVVAAAAAVVQRFADGELHLLHVLPNVAGTAFSPAPGPDMFDAGRAILEAAARTAREACAWGVSWRPTWFSSGLTTVPGSLTPCSDPSRSRSCATHRVRQSSCGPKRRRTSPRSSLRAPTACERGENPRIRASSVHATASITLTATYVTKYPSRSASDGCCSAPESRWRASSSRTACIAASRIPCAGDAAIRRPPAACLLGARQSATTSRLSRAATNSSTFTGFVRYR